jgi:apolipoprotein N-acyltransferase
MVRAVNFGPTTWVDAAGRVRERASPDVPDVLSVDAALLDSPPTFYTRHGDGPLALLLLVLANVAVWRAARRPP